MSREESTPAVQAGPARMREPLYELPRYVAGRGGDNAGVFKLSSNEVPHPPLSPVISAITDAAADINRYGQIYADELTAAVAQRHGLDAEQVLVGNGSVALIEHVVRSAVTAGDEVIYPWRSFEAYPILVEATGAESRQIPNRPDGSHDLTAMLEAITDRTRVILLCTPNNPTGAALTHQSVSEFLAHVPRNVFVVLDEAYANFDRTQDRLDGRRLVADHSNLIVMRTFSKAYGLAGLRVGYAMGRRRHVRVLKAASTPFAVNAIAQRAALTALGQQDAVDAVVADIVTERDRVLTALREQGWDVGDPQGNFYWLALGDLAATFANEAQEAGVMVRPFAGDGVRVSIGEVEANDIALAVTARWARRRLR